MLSFFSGVGNISVKYTVYERGKEEGVIQNGRK